MSMNPASKTGFRPPGTFVQTVKSNVLLFRPAEVCKCGWWLLHALQTHHVLFSISWSLSFFERAKPCPLGYLQTNVASEFCDRCFPSFPASHELKEFQPSFLHFINVAALHGDHEPSVEYWGGWYLHPLRHTSLSLASWLFKGLGRLILHKHLLVGSCSFPLVLKNLAVLSLHSCLQTIPGIPFPQEEK